MIVVSDTSAITALIQVQRIELLAQIYDEIVIPSAVAEELKRSHPRLPDFLHVQVVQDRSQVGRLQADLDLGEAEAIALMLEKRGDILLMDERRGRIIAQREGIPVIGLLGVIIAAKRGGWIDSVKELIDQLESQAGFRLSPELKTRVLEAAGEN